MKLRNKWQRSGVPVSFSVSAIPQAHSCQPRETQREVPIVQLSAQKNGTHRGRERVSALVLRLEEFICVIQMIRASAEVERRRGKDGSMETREPLQNMDWPWWGSQTKFQTWLNTVTAVCVCVCTRACTCAPVQLSLKSLVKHPADCKRSWSAHQEPRRYLAY